MTNPNHDNSHRSEAAEQKLFDWDKAMLAKIPVDFFTGSYNVDTKTK